MRFATVPTHTLTLSHTHIHTQCRTQIQLCQSAFSTFAFSRGGRQGRRGWWGLGEAICGCSRTFLMFDWTLLLFLTAVNGSASVCMCVCVCIRRKGLLGLIGLCACPGTAVKALCHSQPLTRSLSFFFPKQVICSSVHALLNSFLAKRNSA